MQIVACHVVIIKKAASWRPNNNTGWIMNGIRKRTWNTKRIYNEVLHLWWAYRTYRRNLHAKHILGLAMMETDDAWIVVHVPKEQIKFKFDTPRYTYIIRFLFNSIFYYLKKFSFNQSRKTRELSIYRTKCIYNKNICHIRNSFVDHFIHFFLTILQCSHWKREIKRTRKV